MLYYCYAWPILRINLWCIAPFYLFSFSRMAKQDMGMELTAGAIFSNGMSIGLANYFSVFGAFILWALTIWVPYINVGTTIALMTLPIAMSEGKAISPLEIFNPRYRQFMGEMFIMLGLKKLGTSMGFLFLIVPGLVLELAWGLSELLLIDKQLNPAEALSDSNKRMAGNKWTVFFGMLLIILVLGVGIGIVFAILQAILGSESNTAIAIMAVLGILMEIFLVSSILGAKAYVYRLLK